MTTYTLIPIDNSSQSANFVQRIFIDNKFYDFEFRWNSYESRWYLNILTTDGEAIIAGIKLLLKYELLQQHKIVDIPAGSLALLDISGSLDVCGFNDLGINCVLVYTT